MLRNLRNNSKRQVSVFLLLSTIVLSLLFISNAHAAVEYGIAANYPGDAGIENASGFVFRENFEEASISTMTGRWEDISNQNLMSFNADKPSTSAGTKSVFLNGSAHLYRRLLPGYDQLYIRFYVKFDPVCSNIHHAVTMGGYNPTLSYPYPRAGTRPSGNERWSTGIEPMGTDWAWDFYSYWMHMRSNPSGTYYGNSFSGRPSPYTVTKNEWIIVEFMVKMNSPVTSYNGEQAFWINGEKRVHLGQGFPRGEWIWDGFYPNASCTPTVTCNQNGSATPCCQDFEGFQWRNTTALNINFLWLMHYVDTDPSCTVKFDDIVVATQYIGPMVTTSGGDTTLPTVPSNLSAAATSSSQINLSWAASTDNVGVTGYRIYRNGALIDTSAMNSYSNTGLSASTTYTYAVSAYDAAGNVSSQSSSVSATTLNSSNNGGGDTPPPTSANSGGSSDSGGGSGGGCGFMKGKRLKANGEGLSFAIMLIIILGGITMVRKLSINYVFNQLQALRRHFIKHTIALFLIGAFFGFFPALSLAADYHVSPTGAAAWTSCVNINTPCSWQTAMTNAVADDIVYFRGGTYDPGDAPADGYTPAMNPTNSGTLGNPIVFKAYPGETPIIVDGWGPAFGASKRSYITWDGFQSTRSENTQVGKIIEIDYSDNIIIQNCDLRGIPSLDSYNKSGIQIDWSNHVYIYNNKFSAFNGSNVNTGAVWNMSSSYVYFYNNDIYDSEKGFMTKFFPNYVYVYNNYFYNTEIAYYHLPSLGVSPGVDYFVYQNIVNSGSLVYSPDASGVNTNLNIYNNTVYNNTNGAIQIGNNIYHNTRNSKIYNNIIYTTTGTPAFLMYNSTEDLPDYSDYNLFYGNGNWRWDYFTTISSLASWRSTTGFDTNSITSNPLFVNAGGASAADYKLQSNSPARTSGRGGSYATVMGAYITGNEIIGYTSDPTLQFSSATYDVSEAGTTATITVTRSGSSVGAVSVGYATSNGTAAAGSDYTATSGTLLWADGDGASKTFTVSITNDTADESDETINLTLSNPTGGTQLGSQSTATLTILNDDGTNTLQFSSSSYSVNENGITATIRVTRTNSSAGVVGVSYATSNGTATASSDYTARSGTLSWLSGDTTVKTFTVPIANDTAVEGNETINLTLTNPTGSAVVLGSRSTATLTITNDDSNPNPNPNPNNNTISGDISGGGGGCGFVKDNNNGKGPRAKGEGLTLMIMLIMALAGIAIARRVSLLRNSTAFKTF